MGFKEIDATRYLTFDCGTMSKYSMSTSRVTTRAIVANTGVSSQPVGIPNSVNTAGRNA